MSKAVSNYDGINSDIEKLKAFSIATNILRFFQLCIDEHGGNINVIKISRALREGMRKDKRIDVHSTALEHVAIDKAKRYLEKQYNRKLGIEPLSYCAYIIEDATRSYDFNKYFKINTKHHNGLLNIADNDSKNIKVDNIKDANEIIKRFFIELDSEAMELKKIMINKIKKDNDDDK